MLLRSPLSISAGSPSAFRLEWDDFVAEVVNLTVEAYARMCKDNHIVNGWEEDAFSACLAENYLIPISREHPLGLVIELQRPIYTDLMKTGTETTKKAKRVDIKVIFPRWDYVTVYFAWECKKICARSNETQCANLVGEYVSEGIQRFMDGEYSIQVSTAGMLGYVLEGEIDDVVKQINESMTSSRRRSPLSVSDQLSKCTPIGSFESIFTSTHHRSTTKSSIKLIHLFLSFEPT